MAVQITLGMKNKPYWEKLLDLCGKTGRQPADVIHRLIDEGISDELSVLEKEIEIRKEIKKKKGGAQTK